eukprot:CAMPEP_0202071992 /NCGR_PEP_ID=MMETSP0964-20121228/2144_1 /ASSEMBLY_ACC=CAM_ASM_000500 /TAXON_ID=4773 /ORGANISM="Schizochytrium aggregatum, Strain ATCC28209" /LENGTH=594 /DNA_ID=CAMNT_0048639003 /DNA_START=56 /DNA_END=1840 /DNA_ORIENTATION=+
MKRVKQHNSMEAAWSFLLHLEDEGEDSDAGQASASAETSVADALSSAAGARSARNGQHVPIDEQLLHLNDGAKLIICMVGKPARGKTFLAAKIKRYCEWLGYRVKHVETVAVRRKMFGKVEPDDFFDSESVEMKDHRRAAQQESLKVAIEWLQRDEGQVAIYDATNSTRERRAWIKEYVQEHLVDRTQLNSVVSHRVLWVESLSEDNELITRNFLELRATGPPFPEYKGLTDEQATQKFLEKLKFYDQEYEPLDSEKEDISFIRISNFGKQVLVNKINGFLESKLVSFCMNIHTEPRVIVLVRHGQSEFNIQDRIGGDPKITEAGHQFADNLAKYIAENAKNGLQSAEVLSELEENKRDNPYAFNPVEDLHVWTSNLRRTIQTVRNIECRAKVPWVALAEIDAGICECMTYKEFKENLAVQYMKRQRSKATWRYPGGESYLDVKKRLEPVIFELERQRKPVVVCAHRAVLRCLYSYFVGISISRAPFLPFPLHTALVLTPTSSGWREERVPLEPNVGDLGAHEQDVQAAAAKIRKQQAKRRRLAQEAKDQRQLEREQLAASIATSPAPAPATPATASEMALADAAAVTSATAPP